VDRVPLRVMVGVVGALALIIFLSLVVLVSVFGGVR
jgi:hypothetical protein